MSIGSSPLKNLIAIEERIKEVGRTLGVPEDHAIALIEIETRERLIERLDEFRLTQERGTPINWGEIVSKAVCYVAGLLRAEKK